MKSLKDLELEIKGISTVNDLTGVFESLSSMRIAQIKNQVVKSQEYFERLWHMYEQIRVGKYFHYGRQETSLNVSDKELFIAITAEGGFSGEIDQKLVTEMLKNYDSAKNDIIVIGHHGAIQLVQHKVSFQKYFKMPTRDNNINVMPIIREVQRYRTTSVFYQSYESLMVQNIKRISLDRAIEERGSTTKNTNEIISEQTFIFEPSTYAVVDHLERSMMTIALSQTILESKLAQYASRFQAMTMARTKSDELVKELQMTFNRSKREIADERLREIVGGRKVTSRRVAV